MQKTKIRRPIPRRQGGFTLIELSIVIAIGLLLILAGLKFGPQLMMGTRVQSETQNIGGLAQNVRNFYRGLYGGGGGAPLSNAQAVQFSLAPTDLLDGQGGLVGHWGAVTLAPATLAGGGANGAMQVTLANIPQAVCIQLAPSLLGIADEMDVGGQANVKSAAVPNPAPSVVAAGCGAAGASVAIVIRAL